ncbi:hypothetical protein PMIN01_09922 [Paraphaeosphaeria minitans]|uniref:RING-type domain-containing protein n=1 Tax=Paraphaeosphaeria minitans TaxID=565426 RepID=A0A9P6KLY1_9PLEO|nr:hypothetical protein PMIN01_09922 [Paraphaeosphaeria minitans]
MSLLIPNRTQSSARSTHMRASRQSKHTSKRLQRRAKHVKLSGVDYFEAVAAEEQPLTKEQPLPKDFGEYKCDCCQEEFLIEHDLISLCKEGIATCAAHFVCKDCIKTLFDMALKPGWRYFPARCCPSQENHRGIDIKQCVRALHGENWGWKKTRQYSGKAKEYCVMTQTPELHVHCVRCDVWLHPCRLRDVGLSRNQIAHCHTCHANTCMDCKNRWEGIYHRCNGSDDPSTKPDWLPEYASDCRIKPCPRCRTWIELYDACNHMTCENCQYQFCFVCMMDWDGEHPECTVYGDPAGGYDAEGYQLEDSRLHLYTGLDRSGRNLIGELHDEPNFALYGQGIHIQD